MQRPEAYLRLHENRCFSIHKRIEGGATPTQAPAPTPEQAFQYPQADRRGCNLHVCLRLGRVTVSFSIHKRIEGGATIAHPRLDKFSRDVSVSTSGSKGVQHVVGVFAHKGFKSFSIHKRIEGGATCNGIRAPVPPRGFSIHKRIEGGATHRQQFLPICNNMFQYPQADRRGCNCLGRRGITRRPQVSVSTSGSKGVQLEPEKPPHLHPIVSVSTSGSKGVQLDRHCAQPRLLDRFSIHKRIEGGATHR